MKLRLNLLRAMGVDLGAIHAADQSAGDAVKADLCARPDDWLYAATKTAAAAVEEDFNEWRR
jgi:hypothetical protein